MNRLPILKYDKCNNLLFYKKQLHKIREETSELFRAIINKDDDNTLEETIDIIQVAISIIKKHDKDSIDKAFKFHEKKLSERGWEFDNFIKIDL